MEDSVPYTPATNHLDLTYRRKKPSRSEYMAVWRDAHKAQNDEVIECPCGSTFKSISRYTHVGTKKHREWVETALLLEKSGE